MFSRGLRSLSPTSMTSCASEPQGCDALRSAVRFDFERLFRADQIFGPIENRKAILEEGRDAGVRQLRRAHPIDGSVQDLVAKLRIKRFGDRVELVAPYPYSARRDGHRASRARVARTADGRHPQRNAQAVGSIA
jgi:hypothetical protein